MSIRCQRDVTNDAEDDEFLILMNAPAPPPPPHTFPAKIDEHYSQYILPTAKQQRW